MLKYQRRETVTLNLTIDNRIEYRYDTTFSVLRVVYDSWGSRIRGEGVTFTNSKRPTFANLESMGDYSRDDVNMTFIVAKRTT